MLIREVTSAQDQLNLLKRIIDSTWTAISAEAAAEAAAKQQRAAATASTPRPRKTASPNLKPAAAANTASMSNIKSPKNKQTSNAVKNTAQPVQPLAQPQQPRRVFPAPNPKEPVAFEPPKPIARLGKVVAQPIYK